MKYRRKILFACRGFLADTGSAEDATQDFLLRAYQKMGRFRGRNFAGWLMRIARNVCIDTWRKRRADEKVKADDWI